jgi:hypothetical protein
MSGEGNDVKTRDKPEGHVQSDSKRSPGSTSQERADVTAGRRDQVPKSGTNQQGTNRGGGGDGRGGAGGRDGSAPRTSRDYGPGQLDNKARKDIEKERHIHTRAADRAASAEASKATGKAQKITGERIQYHHHADVKEAKRLGLNPDVAGEKNRMSAVDSRKNPSNPSTIGDKSDPSKNPTHTPHNIARAIDKEEQRRTAHAMGQRGDNPRLPKNEEGRKGLVDASATSKQRFPATANYAERGKYNWDRTQPKGPSVNKRGEVIGSKAEGATAKLEKAEPKPQATKSYEDWSDVRKTLEKDKAAQPPTGKGDASTAPKDVGTPPAGVDATKVPKGEGGTPPAGGDAAKVPKGEGGTPLPKTPLDEGWLGKAGRIAGTVGSVLDVIGAVSEAAEFVAREKPELLPEGVTVRLTERGGASAGIHSRDRVHRPGGRGPGDLRELGGQGSVPRRGTAALTREEPGRRQGSHGLSGGSAPITASRKPPALLEPHGKSSFGDFGTWWKLFLYEPLIFPHKNLLSIIY